MRFLHSLCRPASLTQDFLRKELSGDNDEAPWLTVMALWESLQKQPDPEHGSEKEGLYPKTDSVRTKIVHTDA